MFVHTFSHLQSFHTRVAPLPDGFRVRVRFVLRIVGQDGIDHESLQEIEEEITSPAVPPGGRYSENYELIDDTIATMSWWCCFERKSES